MFKAINGGKLPTRATKYSAAVDVYANEDVLISAGETVIVGLGITIDYTNFIKDKKAWINDFKSSHYISLKPRSSLRAKGLISHSAVIDLDYKDEIKMIIHNPTIPNSFRVERIAFDKDYKIKKGDRIGQLLLMEHRSYLFGIESEEERVGGLGSTGDN